MTDQTPSPQSVVVPVSDLERIAQALDNLCGEKTDDLSSRLRDIARAAAPAPSSLAGGEVREQVARIVDPETFALIAYYTGIDRFDGLSPAEREPSVFKAYPDLKAARDAAYADADAILAALSPEAREGAEAAHLGFLVETDDGTEWVEDDPRISGAPEHFENLRPLTLQAAKAEMLASWEVLAEFRADARAALTPRHEAPASEGDA